jgi:two-component system, chemotaxis family, CheB/CheR fusion protein
LKLELISRANSDLQYLLAATDFGTLFLDSGLNIKRFTDRVRDSFSVTTSDEGRPTPILGISFIARLIPLRREIYSRKGRWYDVGMRLCRTVDDKIDGVVITFVDITQRKLMEERLKSLANEAGHPSQN